MPPPTDVVLDPAAAYPEAPTLISALRSRDWPACRAVLDAATPMERSALIWLASEQPDLESFLRSVLTADQADGAASALLGNHLIGIGWRIRTNKRAQYVSQTQFAQFRVWLCRAEQVLIDGAALNPADPAIWTARLVAARGLSLGLAETRRRYGRLLAAHPGHLPGQVQMLQSLCPKWNGSWDLLHEFARDATAAEPPGSPHAVLIADAHFEHAFEQGDVSAMAAYFRQSHVRAELYEAAQRSIGHPGFTRGYGWREALNSFAMCFTLLGDRRAAAATFEQVGIFASEEPWSYLGDAAVEFRKARARVLGRGR